VVTTLIQCSISFLFIVVAERLSHVLLRHSTPRPLAVSPINNDQDAWLLKDEDAGSDHAEETRRLSPQQIESQSSAGNNRFRDVVSVSVIYLLRIGLSNLTATYVIFLDLSIEPN